VVVVVVAVAGEDGDRRLVVEQHLVHPVVHVRRSFDQHVGGSLPGDQLLHQPRTGRAVMPHAYERRRHQPGRMSRASWNAFQ
jgi:hypothetical protein